MNSTSLNRQQQKNKESFYMQVTRTRVIPHKSYHKILYLYPAINDTFVFLGVLGLRQDCVTHMDRNGNVLFEHIFQKPMDAFGMLSINEAIMIETRGNTITILDLLTHEFKRTPHHFFNEESDQSSIITFAESKYLCIQEQGRYNDNRFKLSYYRYPLQSDSKPFNVYEAKDNQWTYEHQVKKANQHSMISWFKPRHDDEWEFKTYDVRDNPKGKLTMYKFPQQIGIPYNMGKIEVALNTIWQSKKDHFMLVCISNKGDDQMNKQLGVIQNNYICQTKTGTIREAKFEFGWHHDYLIDQYSFGRYSMFRTFNFEGGKAISSPVYYLNNESQKIIAEETWECSYLHKYEFPGYDADTLVQNMYENADCDWFECIERKFWNFKEGMLHLLIGMNQNFDEDLLQETMELLDL